MENKKSLRQVLLKIQIGEVREITREEFRPTVVRSTAYNMNADYGIKLIVKYTDYGSRVERMS